MQEETDPAQHEPSEASKQAASRLYQWLYQQVAEDEKVDPQQVRTKLESAGKLSFNETTTAYHLAMQENEKHRSELPQNISQESYEKQAGLHEDVNFLLTDAETSLYEEEGII